MGGLPCAKEVIDGGRAVLAAIAKTQAGLGKALGCMDASVLLYHDTTQPTYGQRDRLLAANAAMVEALKQHGDAVAEIAAEIEKHVSTGGG